MAEGLRERLLRALIRDVPSGDLDAYLPENRLKVSCIIVFWKRVHLLETVLRCLNEQEFDKEEFEVILVEDRGGSPEGRKVYRMFPSLNIKYLSPSKGWGRMGYMRNFGLSHASGEVVVFLDDDTVILQRDFLKRVYDAFQDDRELMAVLPRGEASYCLLQSRYSYHDPHFFTNRCVAYRRTCLIALKGFDSSFIGQEDVEFTIRFLLRRFKYRKAPYIRYLHPPLIVNSLAKPKAVGLSFSRSKYSPIAKIFLFLNGIRWLPRAFYPNKKNIYMSRFALGFAIGFIQGVFGSGDVNYRDS